MQTRQYKPGPIYVCSWKFPPVEHWAKDTFPRGEGQGLWSGLALLVN
jgi:hypothetical protein